MIQLTFPELDPSFQPIFGDIAPHIVEKFVDFHRKNPNIYELFKRFAYDLRKRGKTHYGAKAIIERIRWEIDLQTSPDDFKINDHYTSCYVRFLINEDPSFKDFFEIRHSEVSNFKMVNNQPKLDPTINRGEETMRQ